MWSWNVTQPELIIIKKRCGSRFSQPTGFPGVPKCFPCCDDLLVVALIITIIACLANYCGYPLAIKDHAYLVRSDRKVLHQGSGVLPRSKDGHCTVFKVPNFPDSRRHHLRFSNQQHTLHSDTVVPEATHPHQYSTRTSGRRIQVAPRCERCLQGNHDCTTQADDSADADLV